MEAGEQMTLFKYIDFLERLAASAMYDQPKERLAELVKSGRHPIKGFKTIQPSGKGSGLKTTNNKYYFYLQ